MQTPDEQNQLSRASWLSDVSSTSFDCHVSVRHLFFVWHFSPLCSWFASFQSLISVTLAVSLTHPPLPFSNLFIRVLKSVFCNISVLAVSTGWLTFWDCSEWELLGLYSVSLSYSFTCYWGQISGIYSSFQLLNSVSNKLQSPPYISLQIFLYVGIGCDHGLQSGSDFNQMCYKFWVNTKVTTDVLCQYISLAYFIQLGP